MRFLAVLLILWVKIALAANPTVVFMSDFGTIDDSVAICKGVMLTIEPDLRIIDLTHEVSPFSILDGARFLAGTTAHYPAGTVFLVVIDPGVGSSRKAIVALSEKGHYFVLPDNGLLTLVAHQDGLKEAREITNREWLLDAPTSSTFHGRDIFSSVAAHIASGKDFKAAGSAISIQELKQLPLQSYSAKGSQLSGTIIGLDGPYGNLITNIPGTVLNSHLDPAKSTALKLSIGVREFTIPFVKTFSDVPEGKELVYVDSRGRLGIAVNQGNFAERYAIKPPVAISIQVPFVLE